MEKSYSSNRDLSGISGQFTIHTTEPHKRDRFKIQRTVNGIPVSANDFPERCPIEDSDALRILLTARQRANNSEAMGVPGEGQVIH